MRNTPPTRRWSCWPSTAPRASPGETQLETDRRHIHRKISGTTNMIRIAQVGGSLVNAIGVGSQIASGPLCVCRTLEDIPEKFHPGDVLVVPYTNNEVLPWLRQAAAIVSEEASADCHTATVGLLLNKPVIVAASDATRRLKDGTFVSVDCARGIVQVIPQ